MKANILLLAFIICGASSLTILGDVKIKSKQTMSGQATESTTYIRGKRQRTEAMNGMTISITQCDLRRGVQLNPQAKTYMVNPFAQTSQTATTTKSAPVQSKNAVVRAGGKVTTTYTIKDTGERKQMFGFTARHLIITMETVSSPDACAKTDSKMQMDGWYIDAEFVLDCDYGYQNYSYNANKSDGCQDKYEMKTIGTAKRGYPVYEKLSMLDSTGNEVYSMVNEVVEISKATLESSLFEIPDGYREVADASEMYAHTAVSENTASIDSNSSRGTNSGISAAIPPPLSVAQPTAVGPKKAGMIRIGLAYVRTGSVGSAISAPELSLAVQNSFKQFLKDVQLEVIMLEAKSASVTEVEAKEKDCDFVVYSTVSHRKGGGGFGGFGSALSSAIDSVGLGQAGSVAGEAATANLSAVNVSSNMKSKDEITLDVRLTNAGGSPVLAKAYKAKAKSDGDDIVSQVIDQAAQAIMSAVKR